jgi:hypothetical protein
VSGEKLVRLARVAYEEMRALWSAAQVPQAQLPGAMIVLASANRLRRASSIIGGDNTEIEDFSRTDRASERCCGSAGPCAPTNTGVLAVSSVYRTCISG